MTIKELCEVFSKEVGATFELSKDEIMKQLFVGTTAEMTTEEVFVKMILNSMIISANLSAQTMINGLVIMGVIPKDALAQAKLKPDIHLVKGSQPSVRTDNQGEKSEEEAEDNFMDALNASAAEVWEDALQKGL